MFFIAHGVTGRQVWEPNRAVECDRLYCKSAVVTLAVRDGNYSQPLRILPLYSGDIDPAGGPREKGPWRRQSDSLVMV